MLPDPEDESLPLELPLLELLLLASVVDDDASVVLGSVVLGSLVEDDDDDDDASVVLDSEDVSPLLLDSVSASGVTVVGNTSPVLVVGAPVSMKNGFSSMQAGRRNSSTKLARLIRTSPSRRRSWAR